MTIYMYKSRIFYVIFIYKKQEIFEILLYGDIHRYILIF
jgi:hypothetical protein